MVDVIHNFHELSDLVPALKEASKRMIQDERFEGVKEVLTASAERIRKYKEENPQFADHPICRATESAVELLLYEYEDPHLVSEREHEAQLRHGRAGPFSDYLQPVIDYLDFIWRISP